MPEFIRSMGSRIGIGMLLILSHLPLQVLYFISSFLYIVFYRLIKYRTKVVRQNLQRSFPSKSARELKQLEKDFYKYLADLVMETVKGFTIGKKEMLKRLRFDHLEIYDKLNEEGKSAIVVMGHNGNWEWVCRGAPLFMKNNIIVAYKPLSNPYFDRLMYKARTYFGVRQVPMSQIAKVLLKETKPYLLILAADQSPSDKKTSIWVRFLNQETAVLPGVEKLAVKFKLPVIFHEVKRKKRGFYNCNVKYIVEAGQQAGHGEITAIHTRELEQKIIEQPEIWLWSHKRWKLKND